MSHKFEIYKDKAGEFRVRFKYNSEIMQALEGTIPERAERAHKAGCDIVLNCWAKIDDMQGICEVLPSMSDATAARLDRALALTRIRDDLGAQDELLAKRDALLGLTGEAV